MTTKDLPDWAILSIEQITSSKKDQRIGLLPISRSSWYRLISRGDVPLGQQIMGRLIGWTVRQVREVAEKISNGTLEV